MFAGEGVVASDDDDGGDGVVSDDDSTVEPMAVLNVLLDAITVCDGVVKACPERMCRLMHSAEKMADLMVVGVLFVSLG